MAWYTPDLPGRATLVGAAIGEAAGIANSAFNVHHLAGDHITALSYPVAFAASTAVIAVGALSFGLGGKWLGDLYRMSPERC